MGGPTSENLQAFTSAAAGRSRMLRAMARVGQRYISLLVVAVFGLAACGGAPGVPPAAGDVVDCNGVIVLADLLGDNNGDDEVNEEDCPSGGALDKFLDCDGDGTLETLRDDLTDTNGDGVIDVDDCVLPTDDPTVGVAECNIDEVQTTVAEALRSGGINTLELERCLIPTPCGPIELLEDHDEDGLSSGFEYFMAEKSGGPLDPCEADTDGDEIEDGLDLVRAGNSGVQVNMAILRYEQEAAGEMDDPWGDGDPYFWGGSWLKSSADTLVNVRFKTFTFDSHTEDNVKWRGPRFLERPITLSADVTKWVPNNRSQPALNGSLIVLDHDGAGGGRGVPGSCDAELYLPGEPEISSCDANQEPDPTGLYPPSYGSLALDLVNLLTAIQTGSAIGALPDGSTTAAPGGKDGLVFPLYNVPDPKLRMDIWIRVEDANGNPINPCAVTTATQAHDLLSAGDFLLPKDWDVSCVS